MVWESFALCSNRGRLQELIRSVAQLGRVPALGAGCRGFKSHRSDPPSRLTPPRGGASEGSARAIEFRGWRFGGLRPSDLISVFFYDLESNLTDEK